MRNKYGNVKLMWEFKTKSGKLKCLHSNNTEFVIKNCGVTSSCFAILSWNRIKARPTKIPAISKF